MESVGVVEFRQYTLHPGRRDELIELFEREFVAPQESLGMRVMGHFRDVDRPDMFVWLRGFADMASRPLQLAEFYGGPVWLEHRSAANATMIDSDDVLLLAPLPGAGDPADHGGAALVAADVLTLTRQADACALASQLERLPGAGRTLRAFGPLLAENNFPALPVREGERADSSASQRSPTRRRIASTRRPPP